MNNEELSPLCIAAFFAVFLVMFYFAFSVSPEDVAACVENTGWSEARCEMELTR